MASIETISLALTETKLAGHRDPVIRMGGRQWRDLRDSLITRTESTVSYGSQAPNPLEQLAIDFGTVPSGWGLVGAVLGVPVLVGGTKAEVWCRGRDCMCDGAHVTAIDG
jgi:hypothetical protein